MATLKHKTHPGFAAILGILSVCPSAAAVQYEDFPADLQQILDERISQLDAEGGICIAGRVTMSDGKHIRGGQDVQVNLYDGVDEPLWVYDGGWFIMGRTLSSYLAGPDRGFILRALAYDPVDASVTILDGEMTYLEFEMLRTPPENLASVVGTVFDEDARPFAGAYVSLSFPFANHGYRQGGYTHPQMHVATGFDGRYSFGGLAISEYKVIASAPEYAYHSATFTPPPGGTAVEDRRLYPNRRIVLEYVYQADGTRSFTTGSLQGGVLSWLHGDGGVDFSEGRVEGYDWDSLRDLDMRQNQDVLRFDVRYVGHNQNGLYDAGAVDFESVTQAAETGYSTLEIPSMVGHVYVVRTYEGHYAKFIVQTDEMSFRTVVAGDPDPIHFAGYGLTMDFSFSSGYGRVYVEKHLGPAPLLNVPVLPYYWDVSGMGGVSFVADLTIVYDEADVITMGLSEANMTLLRSTDGGAHWEELYTITDLTSNTLEVQDLSSFGWFAVADLSNVLPGDLDRDDDVDLGDFAQFQTCFTGGQSGQTDVNCAVAVLDRDGDVDEMDFAILGACMSGPGIPGDPACGD